MDISNSDYDTCLKTLKEAEPLIRTQPEGTVLTILDVTNSPFNRDTAKALKEFATANKPYIKMTAVIGVDGMKGIIFDSVLLFSRRKNIVTKNNIHEAMAFLADI